MADALALSDSALDKAIEADMGALRRALGSAVQAAWHLGRKLAVRKRRLSHGEWLPYLNQIGLPVQNRTRGYGHRGQIRTAVRICREPWKTRGPTSEAGPVERRQAECLRLWPGLAARMGDTGEPRDGRPLRGSLLRGSSMTERPRHRMNGRGRSASSSYSSVSSHESPSPGASTLVGGRADSKTFSNNWRGDMTSKRCEQKTLVGYGEPLPGVSVSRGQWVFRDAVRVTSRARRRGAAGVRA